MRTEIRFYTARDTQRGCLVLIRETVKVNDAGWLIYDADGPRDPETGAEVMAIKGLGSGMSWTKPKENIRIASLSVGKWKRELTHVEEIPEREAFALLMMSPRRKS